MSAEKRGRGRPLLYQPCADAVSRSSWRRGEIKPARGLHLSTASVRPLYLFESGWRVTGPQSDSDWVVAYDVEDARRVWCEHFGKDVDDYDYEEWGLLPDTQTVWVLLDPETGELTDMFDGEPSILTARQVVERFGRGFVSSVDY